VIAQAFRVPGLPPADGVLPRKVWCPGLKELFIPRIRSTAPRGRRTLACGPRAVRKRIPSAVLPFFGWLIQISCRLRLCAKRPCLCWISESPSQRQQPQHWHYTASKAKLVDIVAMAAGLGDSGPAAPACLHAITGRGSLSDSAGVRSFRGSNHSPTVLPPVLSLSFAPHQRF
jgi:hypothetical protein